MLNRRKISGWILTFILSVVIFQSPVHADDPLTDEEVIIIDDAKLSYSLEEFSSGNLEFRIELAKPHGVSLVSSDERIVTVNDAGFMNAVSAGTATITIVVKVDDENESYTRTVSVTVYPIQGTITFKNTVLYLVRGTHHDVEYEISNPSLGAGNITWTSVDPSVATVVNGRVTGIKTGSTSIVATVGSVSSEMLVHVVVPLKKVEFNPSKVVLELNTTLSIPDLIYVPYDTTSSRKATYEVENSEIVSLENGSIRGLKIGTTHIFARVGSVVTSLEVTVKPKTETNEYEQLSLSILKETDEGLTLYIKDIDVYQGNRYDLVLPNDALKKYIEVHASTHVYIQLDEMLLKDNLRQLSKVILSKDCLALLNEKKLEIHFTDKKGQSILSYQFAEASDKDINLRFHVFRVEETSIFYKQVQNLAFELRFYNDGGFPKGTTINIHNAMLDNSRSKLHFIYLVNGSELKPTGYDINVDDQGMIGFPLSDTHYMITFSHIGQTADNSIVIGMVVVLILILAGFGGFYGKRLLDKRKSVL